MSQEEGVLSPAIAEAERIATRDLRSLYTPLGILAGRKHFDVLWSWDSFFASLGALVLGDSEVVRRNLETFLRHLRPDGLVPIFVGDSWSRFMLKNLLGVRLPPREPRPLYRVPNFPLAIGSTQNALLLVAAEAYVRATGDASFAGRHLGSFARVLARSAAHDRDGDGLLEQGPMADWADTLLRRGKVLYPNVCHYGGLEAFRGLAEAAGDAAGAARAAADRDAFGERVRRAFFTGELFADTVDRAGRRRLAADGNLLAVFFGLATPAEADAVERTFERSGLDLGSDGPMRSSAPPYSLLDVFPLVWPFLPRYHNGCGWPWLSSLRALVHVRRGALDRAAEVLDRLARLIVEAGVVEEVYDGSVPLRTRFYESEAPLAWAAGLFLAATAALRRAVTPARS